MYIAEQHGEELTYNAENNKIYKVLDRSAGVFTLLPLDGSEPPTSHFSEASLIFRNDIAERSAKIGQIRDKYGINTGKLRDNYGIITENTTDAQQIENGTTTAPQRTNNGNTTEADRRTIGAGTVNLPRISPLYSGDIGAVLYDIEAALDRIFNATNKEATIKKYIEKYEQVKRLAQAGQLYELKLVLKSLLGTIEKQRAMVKGADKYERKQTLKKRVVNGLIITVFAAASLLYFRPWQHSPAPTPPAATIQAATHDPGAYGGELDRAIAEWEQATGKKIYPAGRACLQRTAAKLGLTTQNEFLNLIKINVK
jgi:hypothetical protein